MGHGDHLREAISDLDKVKFLCWDEESLRALLHGATNELLLGNHIGLLKCMIGLRLRRRLLSHEA